MFRLAKINKFVILGIIIAVIAGAVYYFRFNKQEVIETTTIKRGDLQQELVLSGEIVSGEHVSLSFQTPGSISWVGVAEGDYVKKGQLLAKLDTYKLQQDLVRSQFDLRQGDATVYRVYDEVKGHSSDETFVQAEDRTIAEVARDKAYYTVKKIEKELSDARLVSPIEGLVIHTTNPISGVNINQSQTQFEIVNPSSIYFQVSADQTEVVDLFVEQKVSIVLDAFDKHELTGIIDHIAFTPSTGETGSVYDVKVNFVDLNNNSYLYKEGMSGDAVFVTAKQSNVLYAPLQYVKTDENGEYLFVGNSTNKVYVDTGIENEETIEIKGDIKEGETIFNTPV